MTRDEVKRILRTMPGYRPENELLLDTAISEAVMRVFNAFDWSWKRRIDSFASVASQSTYDLNERVDKILEITYGTNNRAVLPIPYWRLTEIYDNVARDGEEVYYYSLYKRDSNVLTLELTPIPDGADTFTYRYLTKIDYGNLEEIPDRLHSMVLTASMEFVGNKVIGSQGFETQLMVAINDDKPITHKRWAMGIDGQIANRINVGNSISNLNGDSGDTTKPYN